MLWTVSRGDEEGCKCRHRGAVQRCVCSDPMFADCSAMHSTFNNHIQTCRRRSENPLAAIRHAIISSLNHAVVEGGSDAS